MKNDVYLYNPQGRAFAAYNLGLTADFDAFQEALRIAIEVGAVVPENGYGLLVGYTLMDLRFFDAHTVYSYWLGLGCPVEDGSAMAVGVNSDGDIDSVSLTELHMEVMMSLGTDASDTVH
jgi:hypothetical protein